MFLPILFLYGARVIADQWLESARDTFGSLLWIICPIACILAIGLPAILLWLAVISARYTRHFAPALVLLVGIVLIPFLPLVPLPKPVFPEEIFFSAHRPEFEQVVTLARQNKLSCIEYLGCDVLARALPPDYEALSRDRMVQVWVRGNGQSGLTVKFWSLNQYYPIIYFEEAEDRNLFWYAECRDSRWTRKLDEHWYLCVADW
jgi:hypothetical protein